MENITINQKNSIDILLIIENINKRLELQTNLNNNEMKDLKLEINKINNIITNKCIISKQISKLSDIDSDILLLILNYIDIGNVILNLLLTNKLFNNLIKHEYNNYIILLYRLDIIDKKYVFNIDNIIPMICIPKNIFTDDMTLEQIFYMPIHNTRSIIDLCTSYHLYKLVKSIYKLFPNFNINCLTIHGTHPIISSYTTGDICMIKLLYKIGIINYSIKNSNVTNKLYEMIDFYNDRLPNYIKPELDKSINKSKSHVYTNYNYNILLNDKYIMNRVMILYKIIDELFNYKMYTQDYIIKIIGL